MPAPWHLVLIKRDANTPLFVIHTMTFLDNGSPNEETVRYYRADKFEFTNSQKFCGVCTGDKFYTSFARYSQPSQTALMAF